MVTLALFKRRAGPLQKFIFKLGQPRARID